MTTPTDQGPAQPAWGAFRPDIPLCRSSHGVVGAVGVIGSSASLGSETGAPIQISDHRPRRRRAVASGVGVVLVLGYLGWILPSLGHARDAGGAHDPCEGNPRGGAGGMTAALPTPTAGPEAFRTDASSTWSATGGCSSCRGRQRRPWRVPARLPVRRRRLTDRSGCLQGWAWRTTVPAPCGRYG